MKKILIVANVAKEHILKFHIPSIKMLKEDGWTVHVACSGEEDIPYSDKKWKMSYGRSPFSLKTLVSIVDLKKIIDIEQYDIIHCHTPTGGLVARLAAISSRRRGTKVIYTAHGYHFYQGAPTINWLLYFPVEWCLSFMTDCIITINDEDFNNTLKFRFGAHQVKKINGVGVDLARFKTKVSDCVKEQYRANLGITENALVLIYIAELIANKNQGFLIKMMARLKKDVNKCYLLLVGPDHINGEYKRLAEQLGVIDKIKFLGWRDDTHELLSISDIAVASSIREGLGLNLIEAMANGIPVVALKNRGHSEIIKNNYSGFLVDQGNIEGMIEKVLLLYKNEQMKKRIVECSKHEVIRFDSMTILYNLKKLYYEISNMNREGD